MTEPCHNDIIMLVDVCQVPSVRHTVHSGTRVHTIWYPPTTVRLGTPSEPSTLNLVRLAHNLTNDVFNIKVVVQR
jgi:hypothetical protein